MFNRTVLKALKPKSLVLSAALALSVNTAASAQVTVDMAKISCEQFALFKVADPDTIAVWLHGYYSGKNGTTVVDIESLKANARKVRDYCLQSPETNLLDAVEKILQP